MTGVIDQIINTGTEVSQAVADIISFLISLYTSFFNFFPSPFNTVASVFSGIAIFIICFRIIAIIKGSG